VHLGVQNPHCLIWASNGLLQLYVPVRTRTTGRPILPRSLSSLLTSKTAQTHPPSLMSSMTLSSSNLQSILDAALDSYAKQTGIDLRKHPSADKLQSCATSEDVLQLLQDREIAFKDYRNKHRKLIDCLRPVVQVVQAFSGVLGEVAGLVSPPNRIRLDMILSSYFSHQVPLQPTKAIFVSVDVLLAVRIIPHFSSRSL